MLSSTFTVVFRIHQVTNRARGVWSLETGSNMSITCSSPSKLNDYAWERTSHTFRASNLQMSRRKFPTIKQQLMMVYSLAGL